MASQEDNIEVGAGAVRGRYLVLIHRHVLPPMAPVFATGPCSKEEAEIWAKVYQERHPTDRVEVLKFEGDTRAATHGDMIVITTFPGSNAKCVFGPFGSGEALDFCKSHCEDYNGSYAYSYPIYPSHES